MPLLQPFGGDAYRVEMPARWAEDLGGRAALGSALLGIEGVVDALVTESSALVVCAPAPASARTDALEAAVAEALLRCAGAPLDAQRVREIDVVYDGSDLAECSRALGLSDDELITRHTASRLRVSFLGFAPGFAYLRGLDPALATLPRRASPRPAVPAFVVAVAAGMSAIYPAASPGGWNLLGRALHFDPLLEPFSVGQEVRFRAVAPEAREQALAREQPASREQVARAEIVEIAAIAGPTLVVDGEPRRRLADGCPRGGPLAPSLARCALRAVGAAHDDALLERHGSVTLVLGGARPRRVADESGRVREIAPGTACTFAAPRETRVGYVAIEGGLDVPVVLGGRGTLLSVRRGGHEGRALRRGDRLALGLTTLERARRNDTSMDDLRSTRENLLRASAGPDLAGDATRSIRARVAHVSDRSGTRLALLEPHGLATREARSAPVVQGAIQATPSGELIVLGPDHPVTGGYPVVGILDAAACDALFARPLGSEVALCIMP